MSFEIVFKALKSDLPILRYVNLNIRNYAQTLVKCLPLFAYTEKSVLPRSGPFSQVLSHIIKPHPGKFQLHSLFSIGVRAKYTQFYNTTNVDQ